jgi:hypothetical protein
MKNKSSLGCETPNCAINSSAMALYTASAPLVALMDTVTVVAPEE